MYAVPKAAFGLRSAETHDDVLQLVKDWQVEYGEFDRPFIAGDQELRIGFDGQKFVVASGGVEAEDVDEMIGTLGEGRFFTPVSKRK